MLKKFIEQRKKKKDLIDMLNVKITALERQQDLQHKVIIEQKEKIQESFRLLEKLQEENTVYEMKIMELEKFMESAKYAVKETKRQNDIEKKKKWLNGYPDETEVK